MLAMLHTSPVHVRTFDRLREEEAPGLSLRHIVAEDLLARAQRDGPASVASDVESALRQAREDGATAVLCTCSTIGGVAEATRAGLPVLRVDRPMAAAAVAAASRAAIGAVGRIRVLAALASTVRPTLDLIAEEAVGDEVTTTASIVDGAWDRFEAGDRDGYLALIAAAITATAAAADAHVIVLAQASMADAAALTTVDIPVLSSPRLGFRAAAELAAGLARGQRPQ
jgi:hypothetical protein